MKTKGITLLEVLIAVTLLSLLSIGMFLAMRIGLNAYAKADSKLMDNRRAAGAQRILEQEIEGLVPVMALCGSAEGTPYRTTFFQGEPQVMRLVSTFSLQQGWRGQPQILELFVIPAEPKGVRLVVNEILYTGPAGAGRLCSAQIPPRFADVEAGPQSFVLADKLAYCRFAYLERPNPFEPPIWQATWAAQAWPLAVRIEMAPLEADPSTVQPITMTAPIYLRRNPMTNYANGLL